MSSNLEFGLVPHAVVILLVMCDVFSTQGDEDDSLRVHVPKWHILWP